RGGAGEVIDRPASVVKELVENALDAGAHHVDVRLAAGGLELIAVRDDGEGMAAEDALVAFARHATSKLARAEDLPTVATLGFRGEALPSIAAVARVRLVTRRAAAAGGVAVEADAGGTRPAGAAGAPPGTSVEVRELFAETPARRKFLRSAATEVGHVVDVLTRLAVASPAVGFRLEHDRREVLAFPPVADARQRLVQVLGRARAAGLVPVEAAAGGYTLAGFLAPPRETLATARLVWTYVAVGGAGSGRWVRDRLLLRAVLDGYASLVMRGRYPIAVLFLGIPPGEVDVNVHPAKLEVRFRSPAAGCRAGGVAGDRLLVPETIALPAAESAALAEHAAALAGAGLEGEPFGEGTFLLRTVPRLLGGRDVGALVRAVAGELVEEGASAAAERATDAALATIACHGLVRVGQRPGAAEAGAPRAAMADLE